jgi:SlyX protein
MSDSRLDHVEEQIAHLTRTTDDLSELLRSLTARLDRLERQLALLLDREAEREEGTGGSVLLSDPRPPHW